MAEPKTKPTTASVREFIANLEDEQQKQDALELLTMHESATKEPAVMWGSSIVGFGQYVINPGKSGQEAIWPLAGFSPRKQSLTIYVMPSWGHIDTQLAKLGKHTTSKACLYIKRLSGVDLKVLQEIIEVSFEESKRRLL